MRFMILIKADRNSEAGILPDRSLLVVMNKYNEALVKAGILLAAEGLHPTSRGARVKFLDGKYAITEGPFGAKEADAGTLLAGFWLIQVSSKAEAIEWVKRCPLDGGTELEIRQVFELDDFANGLTPELKQKGSDLRNRMATRH